VFSDLIRSKLRCLLLRGSCIRFTIGRWKENGHTVSDEISFPLLRADEKRYTGQPLPSALKFLKGKTI
jgi:hypothetical protein